MVLHLENESKSSGSDPTKVVRNIHNMQWLRKTPDRNDCQTTDGGDMPNAPAKPKDGSSSSTAKKKRSDKRKQKKNEANESKSKSVELNFGQGISAVVQSAWGNNKNAAAELFPEASITPRSLVTDEMSDVSALSEAEQMKLAVDASIVTARQELYAIDVPENNEIAVDNDNRSEPDIWTGENKNLPSENCEKSIKSSDTNNNSGVHKIQASKKSMDNLPSRNGAAITLNKAECEAGELGRSDVDRPDFLPVPPANQYVRDQYGRIGGLNETHEFMGKGARRKEYQKQMQSTCGSSQGQRPFNEPYARSSNAPASRGNSGNDDRPTDERDYQKLHNFNPQDSLGPWNADSYDAGSHTENSRQGERSNDRRRNLDSQNPHGPKNAHPYDAGSHTDNARQGDRSNDRHRNFYSQDSNRPRNAQSYGPDSYPDNSRLGNRSYDRRRRNFDSQDSHGPRNAQPYSSGSHSDNSRQGDRSSDRRRNFDSQDSHGPRNAQPYSSGSHSDNSRQGDRSYDRRHRFDSQESHGPKNAQPYSSGSHSDNSRQGDRSSDRRRNSDSQDSHRPRNIQENRNGSLNDHQRSDVPAEAEAETAKQGSLADKPYHPHENPFKYTREDDHEVCNRSNAWDPRGRDGKDNGPSRNDRTDETKEELPIPPLLSVRTEPLQSGTAAVFKGEFSVKSESKSPKEKTVESPVDGNQKRRITDFRSRTLSEASSPNSISSSMYSSVEARTIALAENADLSHEKNNIQMDPVYYTEPPPGFESLQQPQHLRNTQTNTTVAAFQRFSSTLESLMPSYLDTHRLKDTYEQIRFCDPMLYDLLMHKRRYIEQLQREYRAAADWLYQEKVSVSPIAHFQSHEVPFRQLTSSATLNPAADQYYPISQRSGSIQQDFASGFPSMSSHDAQPSVRSSHNVPPPDVLCRDTVGWNESYHSPIGLEQQSQGCETTGTAILGRQNNSVSEQQNYALQNVQRQMNTQPLNDCSARWSSSGCQNVPSDVSRQVPSQVLSPQRGMPPSHSALQFLALYGNNPPLMNKSTNGRTPTHSPQSQGYDIRIRNSIHEGDAEHVSPGNCVNGEPNSITARPERQHVPQHSFGIRGCPPSRGRGRWKQNAK